MRVPDRHEVLDTPLAPPFPEGVDTAIFGMGCFWGAERIFWEAPGVYTTAVGYAGGVHAEPHLRGGLQRAHRAHGGRARRLRHRARRATRRCCKLFWEGHDPTQGMRQGNDVGTQYRSPILLARRGPAQPPPRASLRRLPADALRGRPRRDHDRDRRGRRHPFYYAEDYHQQYLAKNPGGYCGLGGTGVSCPDRPQPASVVERPAPARTLNDGATPPKRGR